MSKNDNIIINRIIKKYDNDKYFIFNDSEEYLINNSSLLKVNSTEELNSLIFDTIFDELIILKSSLTNFKSIEEFLFHALIKSKIVNVAKIELVKLKILNFKKELSEQDFKEILEWGFFDLFNYEIEQKLEFKYTDFKFAYSFFEYPLKPLFATSLDDNYFLFINNSYT